MRSENCPDRKLPMQLFGIFLLFLSLLVACSRRPVHPEPTLVGSEAAINVNNLRPESPVFFTFHYQGKNIDFFVLKVHDEVLSFLDACKRCYPEKRGYQVDNGEIRCRACNVRYSLSQIEKGFGNCFPIRLNGHLQDGVYYIPASQLEAAVDKF